MGARAAAAARPELGRGGGTAALARVDPKGAASTREPGCVDWSARKRVTEAELPGVRGDDPGEGLRLQGRRRS